MFSDNTTLKYMTSSSDNIAEIKRRIEIAEAIVIGAGAGLSSAAGLEYSGKRFQKYFYDFIEKYGFTDMYSGGFYPFETPEEYWAYWSRYIFVNRFECAENGVYKRLLKLVENKEYFVLTTNVDHLFQKSGFNKNRLFYTQGDYGLFQCSEPCHTATYDNEKIIRQMVVVQKNMHIPSELIPVCPKCEKPMTMNLRTDDRFVQDEGWHSASKQYGNFIEKHGSENILFLELGVGYNTPGIIKFPFWKITAKNPEAFYICVNFGEVYVPDEIKKRAICVNSDINEFLKKIS
ncbi:MAG: Sir2 silent information regulator family NAD-dependent deacetylase [Oscillospiraceae bacterium]|nr:Sir2 silent information regulator family NAD-dependent deacetylase [Oscillospiraceae bacterium]